MGNDLSVQGGEKLLKYYGKAIAAYNLVLKTAENAINKMLGVEKGLIEFNKRTPGAVSSKYGDDNFGV